MDDGAAGFQAAFEAAASRLKKINNYNYIYTFFYV